MNQNKPQARSIKLLVLNKEGGEEDFDISPVYSEGGVFTYNIPHGLTVTGTRISRRSKDVTVRSVTLPKTVIGRNVTFTCTVNITSSAFISADCTFKRPLAVMGRVELGRDCRFDRDVLFNDSVTINHGSQFYADLTLGFMGKNKRVTQTLTNVTVTGAIRTKGPRSKTIRRVFTSVHCGRQSYLRDVIFKNTRIHGISEMGHSFERINLVGTQSLLIDCSLEGDTDNYGRLAVQSLSETINFSISKHSSLEIMGGKIKGIEGQGNLNIGSSTEVDSNMARKSWYLGSSEALLPISYTDIPHELLVDNNLVQFIELLPLVRIGNFKMREPGDRKVHIESSMNWVHSLTKDYSMLTTDSYGDLVRIRATVNMFTSHLTIFSIEKVIMDGFTYEPVDELYKEKLSMRAPFSDRD